MNVILLLHSLLVFMIIGAFVTVEIKNMLSAVISVGAVGFALSMTFLFLGAPDIAITQVIVEILSLILLIRATVNVDNVPTWVILGWALVNRVPVIPPETVKLFNVPTEVIFGCALVVTVPAVLA